MPSFNSNLFSLINGLRYFGVGSRVTRSIYKFPDTYWVITRVVLSKDQNHGKVYGRLVWRGRPKETDDKIGSPLKKEWALLSTPDYGRFDAKPEAIAASIPVAPVAQSQSQSQ